MVPKQSRKQGGGGGEGVKTIIILQTSANDPFSFHLFSYENKN